MFLCLYILLLIFIDTSVSLQCAMSLKWRYVDVKLNCEGDVCVNGSASYDGTEGTFRGCLSQTEAIDDDRCKGRNSCNYLNQVTYMGYNLSEITVCCCNRQTLCNIERNEMQTEGFVDNMKQKVVQGVADLINWFAG